MSEPLTKPFTKAEMDAMRTATRDEEGLKQRFWDKLRRVAGRIPFAEDLVAAFYCATDPTTPNRVKLILLGAIAYFVLPTDAVADFLPLMGFADDAAILAAAIAQVAGAIRDDHREKARKTLSDIGK
ncbi:YkvA family protein [Microvirga roseola]|uniref:YkvA family protein n=1 Tax=Microvirga roseola TaxID=2883126 RepID=UPI001E5D1C3E|nr:YkvA family protein [Microvirga roseola]